MKKLFLISTIFAVIIFTIAFCYFNKVSFYNFTEISTIFVTDKNDNDGSNKINEINNPDSENTATVSLLFVGDIMLARGVEYVAPRYTDQSLFPFQYIASTTQKYDLTIGNLETPITSKGPYMVPYSLSFNSNPKYVKVLSNSGFDILSVANNHALDKGEKGLFETVKYLHDVHIDAVGAGSGCHEGVVKEMKGIRLGFLAYSYTGYNDGGYSPSEQVCDWNDFEKVKSDVKKLKAKVDHVVVLPHAGVEYSKSPTSDDEEKMKELIQLGVSVVASAHPHVTQRVDEIYTSDESNIKNKIKGIIAYSLGNFVFDNQENPETEKGLVLEVLLSKSAILSKKDYNIRIREYCCPEVR
jgi:poly-gamma-glutamate synthesis protein (capsule biosynthesis protein)